MWFIFQTVCALFFFFKNHCENKSFDCSYEINIQVSYIYTQVYFRFFLNILEKLWFFSYGILHRFLFCLLFFLLFFSSQIKNFGKQMSKYWMHIDFFANWLFFADEFENVKSVIRLMRILHSTQIMRDGFSQPLTRTTPDMGNREMWVSNLSPLHTTRMTQSLNSDWFGLEPQTYLLDDFDLSDHTKTCVCISLRWLLLVESKRLFNFKKHSKNYFDA